MKHKLLIGIVVGGLVAAYLGRLSIIAGEPVRLAMDAQKLVLAQDWPGLLKMSVKEERDRNGWTSPKFVTFAGMLTKHLNRSNLGSKLVEVAVPPAADREAATWNLDNERRFRWVVNDPTVEINGHTSEVKITVLKDVDGEWRVFVGPLLRDIGRSNRKDPREYIQCFRDALAKAELKNYYNVEGDLFLTVARLDSVLKGELKAGEVWEKKKPY